MTICVEYGRKGGIEEQESALPASVWRLKSASVACIANCHGPFSIGMPMPSPADSVRRVEYAGFVMFHIQ